jgi:large subunit ribosomal protein L21
LALEEGRGKDNAPFDPFSQFLDEMGTTSEVLPGPDADDGSSEDGEAKDMEGIEEAEYKTIEEYKESEEFDEKNLIDFEEVDMSAEDFEDDDDVDDGLMPLYTNTGALYRPKSERLALRAGYPAGGKFAVIHLAGFQHKVTIDDLLVVNKLRPVAHWSVGSTHTLKNEDILLMADQEKTLVGLPGVEGAEVDVMVEEITRDKTMIVFKKRRRKNSRRKNGFRRQVTFLRVLDVRMPGEVADSSGEGEEVQQMAA